MNKQRPPLSEPIEGGARAHFCSFSLKDGRPSNEFARLAASGRGGNGQRNREGFLWRCQGGESERLQVGSARAYFINDDGDVEYSLANTIVPVGHPCHALMTLVAIVNASSLSLGQ